MALKLPGQWVWDSWFVRDGDTFHAFYLQASRALGDPDRRHRNVSVGHSISQDLVNWTTVADALTPSEPPAFDSWTTWTGSVIQQDGLWYMFYTGTSREDAGERQTIGLATSSDLFNWTKQPDQPLAAADPTWYRTLVGGAKNEPFRDPWVFKLEGETEWTMLVTAAAKTAADERQAGVLGVAKSSDLLNWRVAAPLSQPDQGFGETEVFQFAVVDGVPVLLFCCGPIWLSDERRAAGEAGGVYSLVVDAQLKDVNFNRAHLFDAPDLYAARLVEHPELGWCLIGFIDRPGGQFVGELCDPIQVTADPIVGLKRRHL